MLDEKARSAARTASQRWQAAFDDGQIGTLDAVDFTVAVFAVAYGMCVRRSLVLIHAHHHLGKTTCPSS